MEKGKSRNMLRRPLGRILTDGKFISPQDLESALEKQRRANIPLGEILVGMGLLSPDELEVVLFIQSCLSSSEDAASLAAGNRRLTGELLLRAGQITLEQLEHVLKEQERTGERIGEILMRLGFLTRGELDAVLAFQEAQGSEFSDFGYLRLGTLLAATRHITVEQIEEAILRQSLLGKKIGEALVEAGHVKPEHIDYGLRLQHRLVTAALIAALDHASEQEKQGTNGNRDRQKHLSPASVGHL